MKKLLFFALSLALMVPAGAKADSYIFDANLENWGLTSGPVFTDVFALGSVASIDSVEIQLAHSFASDIDFTLTGPGGEFFDLTTDNGSSSNLGDGGSTLPGVVNYIFVDPAGAMGGNGVWQALGGAVPQPAGIWDAETWVAGPFAAGNWTLNLTDDAAGDDGAVGRVVVNFTPGVVIPEPASTALLLVGFGIAAVRRRR